MAESPISASGHVTEIIMPTYRIPLRKRTHCSYTSLAVAAAGVKQKREAGITPHSTSQHKTAHDET